LYKVAIFVLNLAFGENFGKELSPFKHSRCYLILKALWTNQ